MCREMSVYAVARCCRSCGHDIMIRDLREGDGQRQKKKKKRLWIMRVA